MRWKRVRMEESGLVFMIEQAQAFHDEVGIMVQFSPAVGQDEAGQSAGEDPGDGCPSSSSIRSMIPSTMAALP